MGYERPKFGTQPYDEGDYRAFLNGINVNGEQTAIGSQMRSAQLFGVAEDRGHIHPAQWNSRLYLTNEGLMFLRGRRRE